MDLVSMVLNRRLLYFVWVLYIINIQGMAGLSVVVSPSPTVQVVSGQTVSITCLWSADYTGPTATVNYRLNDDLGTIGTMFINFGTGCPSSTPPYTFTCNRARRTLGIQIPVNSYSHGDRLTCEGRNDSTTPPQTDTTTIDVRVPVTSVTITPSTTVTVDVGTSTTLTCTTQPHSRPTASVSWYRVVSGQPQQITANISVSHDLQNSAQTTTSVLSYVPSKEDNGRTMYCVSDGGWTGSTESTLESSRIYLNVRYPPTSLVTVTGNSDPLYDGDDINLRCSISGGNPVAILTWTCPGHSVTTTPDNTGDTASSVLNIQLTTLYNGANCTCSATHPVQAFRESYTEVFNVYFAPRINALTVTEPFPWLARENFIGRLNCDATAGHPSMIRYTWYRDSTPVTAQTSQEISFGPPLSEDNGRLYKCKVENDFTDARGSAPESNTVIVEVEYAPIISLSACPDKINETYNYQCTCTAVGNPNPTVTWYPRDSTTNHILNFPSIDRTNAGRYICNATSSSQKFGTLQTQYVLSLVVQFAPDVQLRVNNATEYDTQLVMTCIASGVPNVYTYGVWTHVYKSSPIRTLNGDVSTQGRTLTLASVSYQDIGTYTCQVENSIRGKNGQLLQTGTAVFDVRGVPRLLEAESRYITEKYQHLNVTMTFISHPSPTDMFLSKNVRLSSSTDLNITFSKDTPNDMFYDKVIRREGYKMVLIFPSFEIYQEGEYNLTVINGVSTNLVHTFHIIMIDVPDFPTDMSIDKITTDSAVVSWKPGLNRGTEEQIFHIWNKEVNTNVWQKYNASYDMTQTEILGLNSDSSYIVILFAQNEKGQSGNTTRIFKTVSQFDDTNQFYKDMYVSSIVLICTSVVILLITIGIVLLTARSRKLPLMKPRMGIQNTSPRTRTGMDDYEHEMSRIRHGQEGHVYTDLDKIDVAEKNVYDQVMSEQNIAVGGQAESNYEQLQGVRSGPNVYEELKGGKDTSSNRIYVNTSPRYVK